MVYILRSFPNFWKASHVGTPLGTDRALPRRGTRGGEGGRFPAPLLRLSKNNAATTRDSAAINIVETMA